MLFLGFTPSRRSIVAELAARHGASVTEFQLYKEEVHPHNQLVDPAAKLADLEFAVAADDDTRVIYYDFEPRVDDFPHNAGHGRLESRADDREHAAILDRSVGG